MQQRGIFWIYEARGNKACEYIAFELEAVLFEVLKAVLGYVSVLVSIGKRFSGDSIGVLYFRYRGHAFFGNLALDERTGMWLDKMGVLVAYEKAGGGHPFTGGVFSPDNGREGDEGHRVCPGACLFRKCLLVGGRLGLGKVEEPTCGGLGAMKSVECLRNVRHLDS